MFSSLSAALVGLGSSFSFSLAFLFAALALAPLPVAARFASITFSSVQQCGSFNVNFVGGKAPDALPLTLSILPLNGTPVFLELPSDAWNATAQTGAAVTFVPFPVGTEFIASLDDANGQGTALVSDVLVVDPSDTDDTSCLPTNSVPFTPQYTALAPLEQCEPFSVLFNATSGRTSPTVRGFTPRGASYPVNQSAPFDDASGVANYTMDAARDTQVVFLYKDPSGYTEVSARMPVLGDIQSSTSCIPTNPLANSATLETTTSDSRVTPKIAVIVIAVCAGVVAIVATAMVTWYIIHRRRVRAQKFTKLDEVQSPTGTGPDPEKQQQGMRRVGSPPPRIITSVNTSPISPVDPRYEELTRYLRNPPYTSMVVTPTSPDGRDPFGEQGMGGSLLGSLSARESLGARDALGATALGNNGSSLSLPWVRETPSVAYSAAARSSMFDPTTEHMPGTSPYFGRMAITPDNSLASVSVLRRPASAQTATTVSSQEIDHILEMATIYGANDLPDMPRPAVTAPATLRQSAYMAGRESRRESGIFSARQSPADSPTTATSSLHGRAGSLALSHSTSQSTLRLNKFREPPLATLPSSPLPSPSARPSFDIDGVAVRDSRSGAAVLQVPRMPLRAALNRNTSSATRASVYSVDDDGLADFAMLQAPTRGSR
ncbi:hypothetical protein TRAPUB_10681 [Trametes pubescens]|uniref:Uncharacterized protein n=1 Tax=Trametes pubescens TaxID=154538 RepID=A0A1M2VZ89_TRAPU|nr:hypothetical protein TRAPUB_10681 [Trametes pubescens]